MTEKERWTKKLVLTESALAQYTKSAIAKRVIMFWSVGTLFIFTVSNVKPSYWYSFFLFVALFIIELYCCLTQEEKWFPRMIEAKAELLKLEAREKKLTRIIRADGMSRCCEVAIRQNKTTSNEEGAGIYCPDCQTDNKFHNGAWESVLKHQISEEYLARAKEAGFRFKMIGGVICLVSGPLYVTGYGGKNRQ
jgi:hypothetical protein